MIIVAGWLRVGEEDRDRYLEMCRPVMETARATAGCRDFHLTADPLDHTRINVYERWETEAAAEQFRATGPSDDHQELIVAAEVDQFEIGTVTSLT